MVDSVVVALWNLEAWRSPRAPDIYADALGHGVSAWNVFPRQPQILARGGLSSVACGIARDVVDFGRGMARDFPCARHLQLAEFSRFQRLPSRLLTPDSGAKTARDSLWPNIRDEERRDSKKTCLLMKIGVIDCRRSFTWRVRWGLRRRCCRSSWRGRTNR